MNVLAASDLPSLLDVLHGEGFTTVAPTLRDGTITLDTIGSVEDLPAGWSTVPAPGRVRPTRRRDGALFAATVGPDSLKRFLFPPEEILCSLRRNGDDATFASARPAAAERYAFLGLRACDLAALAVLDGVLLGDGNPRRPASDPRYRARREAAFLVAVECTEPAATCFCASMGTGPAVTAGAVAGNGGPADSRQAVPDLVLAELGAGEDEGPHRFLVEARTGAGRRVAARLPLDEAAEEDRATARRRVEEAARRMGRSLDAEAAPALLRAHPDHPRWDEVARRCLTCGNCTQVCPTCFCHTVAERGALDGSSAERVRRWDSCFNIDYSYLHGGSVRTSARSRYRQWLTHKLSTWTDQFGSAERPVLGCVGCGRCIAWCPVGIDLTEEVAALGEGAGWPGG